MAGFQFFTTLKVGLRLITKGKMLNFLRTSKFITKAKQALVFFMGFSLALPINANADPSLNNVSYGDVTVVQGGGNTTVNQSSQQAIINWNSFNIANGEHAHFQQPAGGIA